MFDTMTLTKATGAVCGSLLVLLLGGWAAESIYSMGGGHGEDHAQGYVIDTGEDDAAAEVEDTGPDLAQLFAAADPAKGERVFNKCKACHQAEQGANGVGPHLYDVVGRKVDSVEGYSDSGALEKVADVWTAENLFAFLENPAGYAPGTAMGFAGLSKPGDRADVIAYLDQTDGADDIVIEAAAEAPAEDAAAEETPAREAPAEQAPAAEKRSADETPSEEPVGETPSDEAAAEEPAEEPAGENDFAAMVAAADIEAGEKTFRRCAACHAVEPGQNKVGPSLHGVVGRDIASVEGFNYSDALKELDGNWTLDRLSAWIENPRDVAPGNRMGFSGLRDEQDRANVIGYLQSVAN
jgi:cytochrome c2